jgi:DtxR family Mn-dependent transcriptional regulator
MENSVNRDRVIKKTDSIELTHSMVHYLLAIHKLKERRGFARVTDIAKELGLTKGSVSTALTNLKKKSLVKDEKDCKFVILTELGHQEVHSILSSRTLFNYFLKDILGISEDLAAKDSCLIEHLMSKESVTALFKFMKSYGCSCGEVNKETLPELKLSLDLCRFKNEEEFRAWQKKEEMVVEGPRN